MYANCFGGIKRIAEVEQWIEFLKTKNSRDEHLYMIVDCAHDNRIYPALTRTMNTRCCLFAEEHISDAVKAVSPFLVKLKNIDEFVSWCIYEGIHQNWMIFFTSCAQQVSELRVHFKRFSLTDTPDGKKYFFRYYDTRVLPVFLMAGESKDRGEFFRHCNKIWAPQVTPEGKIQLMQLSLDTAGQIHQFQIQNPSLSGS